MQLITTTLLAMVAVCAVRIAAHRLFDRAIHLHFASCDSPHRDARVGMRNEENLVVDGQGACLMLGFTPIVYFTSVVGRVDMRKR